MWIFANNAMVSAVAHRNKENVLMVRGRFAGDLEAFFGWEEGDQRVLRTPDADYLYRCEVETPEFYEALLNSAKRIDYPNFKGSIDETTLGNIRHDAYMRAWSGMLQYQKKLEPGTATMGYHGSFAGRVDWFADQKDEWDEMDEGVEA